VLVALSMLLVFAALVIGQELKADRLEAESEAVSP